MELYREEYAVSQCKKIFGEYLDLTAFNFLEHMVKQIYDDNGSIYDLPGAVGSLVYFHVSSLMRKTLCLGFGWQMIRTKKGIDCIFHPKLKITICLQRVERACRANILPQPILPMGVAKQEQTEVNAQRSFDELDNSFITRIHPHITTDSNQMRMFFLCVSARDEGRGLQVEAELSEPIGYEHGRILTFGDRLVIKDYPEI